MKMTGKTRWLSVQVMTFDSELIQVHGKAAFVHKIPWVRCMYGFKLFTELGWSCPQEFLMRAFRKLFGESSYLLNFSSNCT